MILCQVRFVIKGVDMTDRSRTKDHQHLLSLSFKMGLSGGVWMVRVNIRSNGRLAGKTGGVDRSEQTILVQQLGKSKSTGGKAGILHKAPTVQKGTDRWRKSFLRLLIFKFLRHRKANSLELISARQTISNPSTLAISMEASSSSFSGLRVKINSKARTTEF